MRDEPRQQSNGGCHPQAVFMKFVEGLVAAVADIHLDAVHKIVEGLARKIESLDMRLESPPLKRGWLGHPVATSHLASPPSDLGREALHVATAR